MIKILIADDERRFRDYMTSVLDWEAFGFHICASAKNGEEALELMRLHQPEIALLDINMPRMDGISLTKQVKKLSPNTHIIFITGYSEFEYARKALQLGVSEYLLKPLSKEELLEVLLKVQRIIKKDRENAKRHLKNREIIRKELLNKVVCREQETEEEYQEKLEQLGIRLPYPYYLVSIVKTDKPEVSQNGKNYGTLWKFCIHNILSELGDTSGQTSEEAPGYKQVVFDNYDDCVVSLWNYERKDDSKDIQNRMEKLCTMMRTYFSVSVTVGMGSAVENFSGIPVSYRKAFIALQNNFIYGTGRVISFPQISRQNHKADFYRLELNDRLLIALRKQDLNQVMELLQLVKTEIQEKCYAMDYVNAVIVGLLSLCLSYIVEMKGDILAVLGSDFSPYQELYRLQSVDEGFALLKSVYQATIENFAKPHTKRTVQIIEEVEAYVQNHYQDFELTSDEIADAVFLDISYIRRIFSRYRGSTLLEYITSVRMQAAKALLEQQENTIGEVAERVGYLDAGYFSKCFKKYYHISPRNYVNQLQKRT